MQYEFAAIEVADAGVTAYCPRRVIERKDRPMAKKQPHSSSSSPSNLVLQSIKREVSLKASDLIEKVLKPKHIMPPPPGEQFNYVADITTKWVGSKFYFISIYCCPGPNAISPTFETKFVRMEYVGDNRFALSYMRHTGQWVRLFESLTVDECLRAIRDDPWFQP